ncbi:MAG: AsmA family protein [Chromatiaceae bacterium]
MKLLLKILLTLLVIPIGLIAAVHIFVDPNQYKDEISAWVGALTGRQLTLAGDLGLSLFPWIGVEVRDASLAQPTGFGDEPFARIHEVQARLKFLPLLQGRLELGEVLGTGVILNLIRAPDGRANWDDLAGREPTPIATQAVTPRLPRGDGLAAPPLPAGKGQGIALAGVQVNWDDQESGALLVLKDLSVMIPQLDPEAPLGLTIAGNLAGQGIDSDAHLVLEASVKLPKDGRTLGTTPFTLRLDGLALGDGERVSGNLVGAIQGNLNARVYSFPGLKMQLDLNGGPFQTKPLQINGMADLDLDNQAQTLAVRSLVLESGKIRLTGDAAATQLHADVRYQGHLVLDSFDPRAWLADQGLNLPALTDPTTFTLLTLRSDWQWAADRFDFKGLDMTLDKSRVSGTWSWLSGAAAGQEFDLRMDRLDLDAYLPPSSALPVPVASSGALPPPDLARPPLLLRLLAAEALAAPAPPPGLAPYLDPVAAIRALNLQGRLRINQLRFRGLTFGDFDGRFTSRDGQFRLEEQVARFYAGKLQGQVAIDANQAPPLLTLNQKAEAVSVGDLLRDLKGDGRLTGTGNLMVDLSTRGLSQQEFIQGLTGQASLKIAKGFLRGFDMERAIQRAEAGIRGNAGPPKADGPEQTEFSDLQATAQIERGIIATQDLQANSGYFKAKGKGRIDLPKDDLDFDIEARVVNAPADRAIKEIEGIPIPIHVSGSIQFPDWRLDPAPVVREVARRRLEQELGRGDGNRLQQLEERTGIRGLEKGLKSLLGR